MNETWRYGQDLREQTQEKVSDTLLGQIKYNTLEGQTVKLPAYYQHVYTNTEGEYLLHNDVSWDPNRDLPVNEPKWQRIDRAD